jgi:hypothetical protein
VRSDRIKTGLASADHDTYLTLRPPLGTEFDRTGGEGEKRVVASNAFTPHSHRVEVEFRAYG